LNEQIFGQKTLRKKTKKNSLQKFVFDALLAFLLELAE
jgi:hypothetical protein